MKGFIEVFVIQISDMFGHNKSVGENVILPLKDIKAVSKSCIKVEELGSFLLYNVKESYKEIKQKMEEASNGR